MVHGSRVTLISIVILKIPMTALHAAPMGKFKEELAHRIEYCEIFSHQMYLITVNHSRTNFHQCPTGSQHVKSKWAHLYIWAMRLTRLSFDSLQPAMVVGKLGQMSSHVATFWVLSLAFWIQVFGDEHHWLLSPCCYITCMWTVPTCNRQKLGAISSRIDAQKHLADLLHSAGKASSQLSGWGLSYNRSQCTHRRLQGLDIPNIEMGTAVVINNLWSIGNNPTANIGFPLTCGLIFLPAVLYRELFLPLALRYMTNSERWWAWWRNISKTSASSTWTRTWDVFCDAHAAKMTNTSQVLVCGDDADVFILLIHHAHCHCEVVMELDVNGRNNWRFINISELARKIDPQVSEISLFPILWFRID